MNGFKFIRNNVINMTLEELADKLGISKQVVYTWDSGKKPIPTVRLQKLSEITGIPEMYFLKKEISEEEELEIKQYYFRKSVGDTEAEYRAKKDSAVHDIGVSDSMEVDINKLVSKIERNIKFPHCIERIDNDCEKVRQIDKIRGVYEKFVGIVTRAENQMSILIQILRALEFYFDDNITGREAVRYPDSLLCDETFLVQDLYRVLFEHKRRMSLDEEEIRGREERVEEFFDFHRL